MKLIHNSPQLRDWLKRDGAIASHIATSEFHFEDEIFAKAMAEVAHQHPAMNQWNVELRAAFLLLRQGHSGKMPLQQKAIRWPMIGWIVAALLAILLGAALITRANDEVGSWYYPNTVSHAQIIRSLRLWPEPQTGGIVIQLQNAGTPLTTRGGGLVAFNCGSGMSCSFSGSTFTMTATGGGMGCTLQGGTNLLLYDTSTACEDITKWSTNGTTTITALATAIFDATAAATFKFKVGTGSTLTADGTSGQVLESNADGTFTPADPIVSGPDAPGAVPTKNPVQMGLFDGTDVQRVLGSVAGRLSVDVNSAPTTAVTGTFYQATQPVSCTAANCLFNLSQVGGASFALGQQLAAASLPMVLTAAQITTLTPPTAAAIGTSTSTDLLIGTQVAGSSVPVALPTATITTLTPPTAAAIGTAVSTDLTTITVTQATGTNLHTVCDSGCSSSAGFTDNSAFTVNTTPINPIGGLYDTGADPAISNGNAGRARIDLHSYLFTDIGSILGTAPTTAGFLDVKGGDGNVFVRQTTGSNLHTVTDTGSTTAVTGVVEVGPTTSANTAANAFFNQIVDASANPMGTMTNFGSTPSTAKALNANASCFIGTVACSNKSTTISTGTFDVNLVGSLGVTMSATNPIFSNITDGTTALVADVSAYGTAPTGTEALGVNAYVTGTKDPCTGVKTPKPFSLASATALALVTAVASQYIHVCSLNIVSASAENVALIEGTKTTTDCDTSTAGVAGGTTAATGWNLAANGGLALGAGNGTVFETATAAHELCLLSSGTTQLSGSIMYVQTTVQ